jgi:integrase
LIKFSGADLKAAEAAERAGASDIVQAAAAQKTKPISGQTVRDLVQLYREAPEGARRQSSSTRREWSRFADRIVDDLGDLPIRALAAKGAVALLTEWRDGYSAKPRTADYGVQVLRRILQIAVNRELLSRNPAANIESIYKVDRSDVIVSADELRSICSNATPCASKAIRLAAALGIRRGDLISLRWDQVREHHIELDTEKSRGRTFVIAPLIGDGQKVMSELRDEREQARRDGKISSVYVLVTEKGTPWKPASLSQAFGRAAAKAGINKSLHDLRGTAVTRFISSGFSPQETATFVGWEEVHVQRIIKRYVSPRKVALDAIARSEQGASMPIERGAETG